MVDEEVSIITKERLGFFIMFTLTSSVSQRTLVLSLEVICRIAWGWISSFWLHSVSHSIIYWSRCNDGAATRCLKGMLDKLKRKSLDRLVGRCWMSSSLISCSPGQLCPVITMECRHTYLTSHVGRIYEEHAFKKICLDLKVRLFPLKSFCHKHCQNYSLQDLFFISSNWWWWLIKINHT